MPSWTLCAVAGGEDGGDAGLHGVIDRGDPAAERRGEHEPRADEVEQLHVGREAEGEADRVARDLALTAGDRIEVAVDLDQDHRLDLADPAARLADRVSGVERHAATGE